MSHNSTEKLELIPTKILLASIVFKFVAMVIGVFGNAAVIIYNVFMNKKKTATSYLIANLAVTDMLVCLAFYPIWITEFILSIAGIESDQNLLCKMSLSAIKTLLFTSVATLLFITIDRYVFIVKPLKYAVIVTKRRVMLVIVSIWLTAFGILCLKVSLQEKNKQLKRSLCDINKFVFWFWEVFSKVIPILLVTVLNYKIFIIAQEQRRRIENEMAEFEMPNEETGQNKRKSFHQKIRAFNIVKTFFIVVLVLAFCCLIPALIGLVLYYIVKSKFSHIWYVIIVYELAGINSIVNAFIYGMRHAEYRKAYKHLLSKLCQFCKSQ